MRHTFAAIALALCGAPAVAQTPQQIHQDYEARRAELSAARVCEALDEAQLSAEGREALEFLYAYMPWPDIADYTPSFHTAQVETALRAREEMPWGHTVPRREWLHFVLPVRVNNENLDGFRTSLYDELRERVRGLSMEQAVLEVNHWCHEHVTYKPSDGRTSAPLASMRTATGRCGEESTYTVAALRAVGIPARQVYTPRWAHTDDNHAWVEAWVDGKWHFLGACEPEAVLDLGWFNQPASRGMLMHTQVFGRYDGPEDVISRSRCYTEINVTANYAATARTSVLVTDAEGKPVPGAVVDFKLYNYGELYTVQTSTADASGRASILTGLGDMVAWASKDGAYGFAKFSAGRDGEVTVQLSHKAGETFAGDLTLVPPTGKNNIPAVSAEAAAANAARFAREDSIRLAYVATFADSVSTDSVCQALGLDYARVRPLVVKSRGNWENLYSLLDTYPNALTLSVLESLSDKDLRDFPLEVMEDHLQFVQPEDEGESAFADEDGNALDAAPAAPAALALSEAQEAFRTRYVYCPRIANEMLTGWRSYFGGAFTESEQKDYVKNPQKLAKWIDKNILSDPEANPRGYCLSPAQAMETRRADARNKGILFVAACRSLGVPARIDEVTGKVQYAAAPTPADMPTESTAEWQTVSFEKGGSPASSAHATLSLAYTPREYMKNPVYYTHFTLSTLSDGRADLQTYPETATWGDTFKGGAAVDAGDYLLTSGTRMADGTVLARYSVFPVQTGENATRELVMREDKEGVQVIGSLNAEDLYLDLKSGAEKSILSTTGRGYYALALLRAGHEPSNHALHDIEKLRAELEAWGRPILALFPSEDDHARFAAASAEFGSLPSTLVWGVDKDGAVARELAAGGLSQGSELPVVVIADTFNRVVFCSQGYTIGIGERLKNTVGKLK